MLITPLIFGISTTSLTLEEISIFTENPCAGFILFARNIESREQVIALTSSLKALYPDREVPIFIDQEGGRVARIKPPIASELYPAAGFFAEIYLENEVQAKDEVYANYSKLIKELKLLGIDSPCAPVCDLLFAGANNVIGDRSFGKNPAQVIDLCLKTIEAIIDEGGIAFLKHIPGHGRALVDSHHELPRVTTSLEELEETDFKVFRELSTVISENKTEDKVWGMTAHIIYDALDKEKPATISGEAITYIKEKIGFKGNLLSDDIGMSALHGDIGKKHSLLKKTLASLEKGLPLNNIVQTELSELFNINHEEITNIPLGSWTEQMKVIRPEFIKSLTCATQNAIAAGCDYVLHCSGDITEMKAVLEGCFSN